MSKQIRVRLIPLRFYIIFVEESEFEDEKLGKAYAELKDVGPSKSKNIQECQKMGSGRWARRCATARKHFFPVEKGRDGAQIDKMLFWGLRNSLSAGKNMYHEENLRPDSMLKWRSHQLFKNVPFWAKYVSAFFS